MQTKSLLCCFIFSGLSYDNGVQASGFNYRNFCGNAEYVSPTLGPTKRLNKDFQDDPHLHCYNSPGNGVHLTYAPQARIYYIHGNNFYLDAYNTALYYAQFSNVVYDYTSWSYRVALENYFYFYNSAPLKLLSHLDFSKNSLLNAIRKGKIAEVRKLLEEGSNPDEYFVIKHSWKKKTRINALAISVLAMDTEMVELLLSRKANINARSSVLNSEGTQLVKRTPLGLAAAFGLVPMIKTLLSHKADPNSREVTLTINSMINSKQTDTPLSLAAAKSHIEAASLLQKHGADRRHKLISKKMKAKINSLPDKVVKKTPWLKNQTEYTQPKVKINKHGEIRAKPTQLLEDIQPLYYPGDENAKVGHGISYKTGKVVLESAIDLTALNPLNTDNATVQEYNKVIKERSEYNKLLSDSAKITGSGIGWSVSTSTSYLDQQEFNENHLIFNASYFATLKTIEIDSTDQRNPIRLTETSLDFLIENGAEKFLDFYGSHFVSTIRLGGSFLGQYNLNFSSEATKKEFINEFGADWTNGEMKAGFSNTLKKETQSFSSKVTMTSNWLALGAVPGKSGTSPDPYPNPDDEGGIYALESDFVETLKENAAKFPEILEKQSMVAYPWSALYQIQQLIAGNKVVWTESGWKKVNDQPVVIKDIDLLSSPNGTVVETISAEVQALLKLQTDVSDFKEQGQFVI